MRILNLLLLAPMLAMAERIIFSNSLTTCMENSGMSASVFSVSFTPDNKTLAVNIVGVSSINGNVTISLQLLAYGYSVIQQKLDPCTTSTLRGLCPMNTGQIDLPATVTLTDSMINMVPSIAYEIPDLDAKAIITILDANTGAQLACVQTSLSNGKTVDTKIVGWITAVIVGLAIVASAVAHSLGHSSTSAHIASNALSLFAYYQSLALIGMVAVPFPPIAASWTQNFQWTMGIIKVDFMQNIFSWYIQATGGTPSNLLNQLSTTSIQVIKKRDLLNPMKRELASRMTSHWARLVSRGLQIRTNNDSEINEVGSITVLKGIQRVAYRAGIEITNVFVTGLTFFLIFIFLVLLLFMVFKGGCELASRRGWLKGDRFGDFRRNWRIVIKGVMYRLTLIGWTQIATLSLWELTQRDSPAAMVLAITIFLTMLGLLSWGSYKVVKIARSSVAMHKNAAYLLFSDPEHLNRWGFLYVQFRATAYFFIIPFLVYYLLKACLIAFGQNSGIGQAIGLVIVEGFYLVGISWLRPFMDKRTNSFNISISAVTFVNVIFLIFFTNISGVPPLVVGVMGVVFFILNAVFALVLMILVGISTGYAIFSKNPDSRYQPMRDDRASFIKSASHLALPTELDALGATARGDIKAYHNYKPTRDLEDDGSSDHSLMKPSMGQVRNNQSPGDQTTPFFAAAQRPSTDSRSRSPFVDSPSRSNSPRPQNYEPYHSGYAQQRRFDADNNDMWKRGVGYDH